MLLMLIVKTAISQALWHDITALSQMKQVGILEPVQCQLKPSSLWRTWRSAIHRRQCHRTTAACKQRFPPDAPCFLVLSKPESGFELPSTDDIIYNSSQDLFKLFPTFIQECTSCPAPCAGPWVIQPIWKTLPNTGKRQSCNGSQRMLSSPLTALKGNNLDHMI